MQTGPDRELFTNRKTIETQFVQKTPWQLVHGATNQRALFSILRVPLESSEIRQGLLLFLRVCMAELVQLWQVVVSRGGGNTVVLLNV